MPSNKKKILAKKKPLPDAVSNANSTFGMKSNYYRNPDEASIAELIKGSFNKDYLEDRVTRNVIKEIVSKTLLKE